MSQPARPAATVAVLRDGTDGIEVFLVKRNAKTSFFPHAHVFPGGRVDPADAAVSMVGGAWVEAASDMRLAVSLEDARF